MDGKRDQVTLRKPLLSRIKFVLKILAIVGLIIIGFVIVVRVRGPVLQAEAVNGAIVGVSDGYCLPDSHEEGRTLYTCYTMGNTVTVWCLKGVHLSHRQVTIGSREPFVSFQ